MKKYENPEFKISKFMTENIITSSGTDAQKPDAVAVAKTWLNEQSVDVNNVFEFTF